MNRLWITALVPLAAAPLASQGVIDVPGDRPTIMAAVYAAQPGDRIHVAPGTYFEQVDYLGKAILLIWVS